MDVKCVSKQCLGREETCWAPPLLTEWDDSLAVGGREQRPFVGPMSRGTRNAAEDWIDTD